MWTIRFTRFTQIALCLLFMCSLAGGVYADDEDENHKGKLSDAMEKGAEKGGDRVVKTQADPDYSYDDDDDDEMGALELIFRIIFGIFKIFASAETDAGDYDSNRYKYQDNPDYSSPDIDEELVVEPVVEPVAVAVIEEPADQANAEKLQHDLFVTSQFDSTDVDEPDREISISTRPERDDDPPIRIYPPPEIPGGPNTPDDFVPSAEYRRYEGEYSPPSRPEGFGIKYHSGLLYNDDFYGFSGISLLLIDIKEEWLRLNLHGGVYWAPVQATSELSQSIRGGVTMWILGVQGNLFATCDHTFMGLYGFAGGGLNYMHWSYQNDLIAHTYDDDGNIKGMEIIDGDGLAGLETYLGLGWNVAQFKSLEIGASISPGAIWWIGETSEGFTNDVFDPFIYLKAGLHIKFKW